MPGDFETLHVGLDEAGRGPVLGDLVIGSVAMTEGDALSLREAGVRDSKELTPSQREQYLSLLAERSLLIGTAYLSPAAVDRDNLNRLVARAAVSLANLALRALRAICGGARLVRVYVDEIKGYGDFIKSSISREGFEAVEVLVESFADRKYAVVSAASIVAKCYRDKNLLPAKRVFGDFGSGYPADRRTRSWLSKCYEVYRDPPPIVRRTWSTLLSLAPRWYSSGWRGKTILDYLRG